MNSPAVLIAVPLLLAFLSVVIKKWAKLFVAVGVLFNLAALAIVTKGIYAIGGWKLPYGISLVMDNYAWYGLLIENLILAVTLLLAFDVIGKHATPLLVSIAALNGIILTGDLFNLFVFLEIGAIAAYILSSMSGKYLHSFNYLVQGTLGSSFYLLGIMLIYALYGSLNMADIHERMLTSAVPASALLLPLLMVFIGLAVETKLMPFNGWVKGVYGNTNSLTGPIFASGYALAVMLAFGRLFASVFVVPLAVRTAILVVATATLLLAEFAAFSRRSLREILLYSSIAQSGLAATLFILGLTGPALLVLLNNVAAKLVMFGVAGGLATTTGTDDPEKLRGIFLKNRLVGFGFTVAALSLMGLPLFYGFFAKLTALLALFDSGNLWLPAVILLAGLIEGAYLVRLLVKLWNPGDEGTEASAEFATTLSFNNSFRVGTIVAVVGVLLIVVGVFPGLVSNHVQTITHLDVPAFTANWLGGISK